MTDNLLNIKKSFSDLGIELKVGIEESNLGACTGEWIAAEDMHELVSYSPTDAQPIASIIQADEAAYEKVVATAAETFKTWRMVPAPASRCSGRSGTPGSTPRTSITSTPTRRARQRATRSWRWRFARSLAMPPRACLSRRRSR